MFVHYKYRNDPNILHRQCNDKVFGIYEGSMKLTYSLGQPFWGRTWIVTYDIRADQNHYIKSSTLDTIIINYILLQFRFDLQI